MKTTAVLAALCFAVATFACADDLAHAPQAGTYLADIYVKSFSGTQCHQVQVQYTGEMSFAGLDGSTDYIRIPVAAGRDIGVSASTTSFPTADHGTRRRSCPKTDLLS